MSAPIPQRRPIAGFTGRTWVMDRVNEWLGSTGQPVFVITGLQGTGKSTLAKRFAQISRGEVAPAGDRLGKGFLTYAHFCQGDTDRATLLPHRFIESLSAAVAERYETAAKFLAESLRGNQQITFSAKLTVSGPIENGAALKNQEVNIYSGDANSLIDFDKLVRKPIEKVAAERPDERFVFLIDGLDEALAIDSNTTILDLLRDFRHFPPQVRWLITCRSDERILDVLGPSTLELTGKENQGDLYKFAYESLTGFQEPLRISRARAISEKQDFLYARCLLEDEKLVALLADTKSELSLPEDMPDLYRTSLLKHGLDPGKPSWEERYQPVLGAIVASFGKGLTASQLVLVTHMPASRVDAALKVCRRFCQNTETGGPFQIDHATFREFLKSDVKYRVYADEANVSIAQSFYNAHKARWLACEDLYALKYLPLHLLTAIQGKTSEAECGKTLLQLMTDLSYLGQSAKAGNLDALVEALRATQSMVPASAAEASEISKLVQVLEAEGFIMRRWSRAAAEKRVLVRDSFFWQQVRNRAFGFGFQNIVDRAHRILEEIGEPYLLEHWPLKKAPKGGLGLLLAGFGSKASVSSLLVTENPRLVAAGSRSGEIRIYDLATGASSGTLSGHTAKILALAFITDRLYSVCASGWIISWNIETRERIRKRRLSNLRELTAAAFASSARRLLACTDKGEVLLTGLDNPSRPRRLSMRTTISGLVAVSDDARFALSTDGKANVSIWKLGTGKKRDVKLPELPPPTGFGDILLSWFPGTIDAVFSQDEKRAVVTQIAGNRSAFLVCDVQSGKILFHKSYTDRLLSVPVELSKDLFAYARNWFGLDVSRKEDERPIAATYLNARIDHIVTTNDGYIVVGDRQGYVRTFRYVQRNR